MSKELTPLEALEEIKSTWNCMNPNWSLAKYSHFDIIETALKDYEKRLILAKEYQDINNVAKRLKALEIIKRFNIVLDLHNALKPFISKEEYDLLREILL